MIDDTQVLLKGGRSPFHQEPLNEALASTLANRLGISHVSYSVMWENDLLYSGCENFITPRTELVTAYQICETKPFPEGGELYEHYAEHLNSDSPAKKQGGFFAYSDL